METATLINKHLICLEGIELSIVGDYEPGEQRLRDYPGSPESFIIEKVFIQNTNIYELLSRIKVEQLEEMVLDTYYR